jgi:hypothetical protein
MSETKEIKKTLFAEILEGQAKLIPTFELEIRLGM